MVLLLYLIVLATSSFATPVTGDGEASPEIELEPFAICNATNPWHYYLPNSSFEANLAKISAAFPSVASANGGFAKGPVGAAPDTVYGLALCRGDTDGDSCKTCIEKAFQDAQSSCGYGKDAAVYHDRCHVRISDSDFLAPNTNEPTRDMWNPSNITEPSTFLGLEWDAEEDSESVALVVGGLVSAFLRETAKFAADNTPGRFATAAMDIGGLELYSMAQCTPDLLTPVCVQCLEDIIIRGTPASFKTRQGRRFLGVRCSFRYESYSFYEGKPMWIFGPTPYQGQRRDRSMRKLISAIGAVISLLLLLVCFFLGFGWMRSRRKEKVHLQVRPTVGLHEGEALMWTTEGNVSSDFCLFDFPQIQQATNNFSEQNKLGQGGFGPVYKGELPDGMEIAVKRLCTNSGQGFVEFKNEVQLIAKLQHTNLVRLLGCCSQGEEKMLVYEYLPNRSLDLFIFDTPEKRVLLEWKKRLLIVQGIVQGLLYLHKHSRLHIIHRDLKASNILLDQNMNPKISDFGIAKIFISNDTEDNTNTVVGTYGYMAPEYAYEGLFSIKSDVFSFGVLLLEIISGKRNSIIRQNGCSLNLLGYAWHLWKEGKWIELVDTSLVIENCTSELSKCINIALLCVQENAADRPTMWDVSTMLSTEGASLPEPKQPAYYNGRVAKSLDVGLELHSINEVTITAQEGR